MNIEMTDRDLTVILGALRYQEQAHKRNDFMVLVYEIQEIRSRLNDARIDENLAVR